MKAKFFLSFAILIAASTIVGGFTMPAIGVVFGILGLIRMFGVNLSGVLPMAFVADGTYYPGKEFIEGIIRPCLGRTLPKGIRLFETGGARTARVTYWGPAVASTIIYESGFQGGVNGEREQKDFNLGQWKAENKFNKQNYLNLIHEQSAVITKDSFQNDIMKSEMMESLPTPVRDMVDSLGGDDVKIVATVAEWMLLQRGIDLGIFNMFWLADTNKLALESAGGVFPNGAAFARYDADKRFNMFNGIWKNIFSSASLTPNVNQVQKVAITLSAVSEVRTVTITGTSGTANITILGKTKLATFTGGTLTNTAAAFVSSWASYYAAFGMVITSSGADVICTYSGYKGVAFAAPTITNVSGDLAGSVALTTPAVAAGNLGAGDSITIMNNMIAAQSDVLKDMDDKDKVFYLTRTMIDNYKAFLGLGGSGSTTLDAQRNAMINGLSDLMYNGIRIEPMKIDSAITSYFGGYSPHRAILTTNNNLTLVVSWAGKFGEAAGWFNKDENEYRTRAQGEMGADFFFPELMVAAFQG